MLSQEPGAKASPSVRLPQALGRCSGKMRHMQKWHSSQRFGPHSGPKFRLRIPAQHSGQDSGLKFGHKISGENFCQIFRPKIPQAEAEAEATAEVEAEADAEANARGRGRGKGRRDFLNIFYKVTTELIGIGDCKNKSPKKEL